MTDVAIPSGPGQKNGPPPVARQSEAGDRVAPARENIASSSPPAAGNHTGRTGRQAGVIREATPMSPDGKGRVAGMPGTEEEKIRQLIRELHEAAQDARAAAKALDAAQRSYAGSVAKHYKKAISEADLQFKAAVEEGFRIVATQLQERFADLIGASSPDETLEVILKGVRADLLNSINRIARTAVIESILPELPALIRREIKDDRLRSLIIEEFHNQLELMLGSPISGAASALPSWRGGIVTVVQDTSGRNHHTRKRR